YAPPSPTSPPRLDTVSGLLTWGRVVRSPLTVFPDISPARLLLCSARSRFPVCCCCSRSHSQLPHLLDLLGLRHLGRGYCTRSSHMVPRKSRQAPQPTDPGSGRKC